MPITPEEIEKRFTYHPPQPGQPARYEQIRYTAKELALTICSLTPPSREQSLAITALEEAVFWANAAIARNEGPAIPDSNTLYPDVLTTQAPASSPPENGAARLLKLLTAHNLEDQYLDDLSTYGLAAELATLIKRWGVTEETLSAWEKEKDSSSQTNDL